MSLDITAKIKAGKTITDVCSEIITLNTLVGKLGINPETGEDFFPRPIPVTASTVGSAMTPVDAYGRFQTRIDNYEYIDWSLLPAPQTFTIVSGKPSTVPVFA